MSKRAWRTDKEAKAIMARMRRSLQVRCPSAAPSRVSGAATRMGST
jgi:hypothetical protein